MDRTDPVDHGHVLPDARPRRGRGLRMGVVAAGVAGSLGVVPAASAEPGTGSSVTGSSTGATAVVATAERTDAAGAPSRWRGRAAPGLLSGSGLAHAATGGS